MKYSFFLLSFFFNTTSLFFLEKPNFGWIATFFWFLSLILLFLGSYRYEKKQACFSSNECLVFSGGILIFLGLRLVRLANIPYFVNGDEAWIGVEARKILDGKIPHLFSFGWYNYPQLTFFLAAIPMKLFNSLFGLRLHSVVMATISVYFTYKLTRLILNRRSACFACVILLLSHYHLHFSRSGTQYMQGVTFCLISLYFFISGVKNKETHSFILSGIFTALGLEVYLSARITLPLLLIFCLLLLVFKNWSFFPKAKHIFAFLIAFYFSISPMILLWRKNPSAFFTRSDISIFMQKELIQNEYNTSNWGKILLGQMGKITSFFIIGGDRSSQYGNKLAAIDQITLFLFIFGCAFIIFDISKFIRLPKNRLNASSFNLSVMTFMIIWIVITCFIGGVLTIDAPFSPRLLMVVIPIAIISGFFLDRLATFNGKYKLFPNVFIIFCFFGIAILNVKNYFFDFQKQDIDLNSYRYTVLAHNLPPYPQKYQFSLIQNSSLIFDHATIHFLNPYAWGETYDELNSDLINSFGKNNSIYIFTQDRIGDYFSLKKDYPQLKEKIIFGKKKDNLFILAIPSQ